MTEIQKFLFEQQDLKYRDFHSKIVNNIPKEAIVGVRLPIIKNYAKILIKENKHKVFVNSLPHRYYDEYALHIQILNLLKNYEEFVGELDKMLPYLNNWALTDMVNSDVVELEKEKFINKIHEYLSSTHPFTIRLGIVLLKSHYIKGKEDITPYIEMVVNIKSNEYYVNMAIAWFLQSAYVYHKETLEKYINTEYLSPWVYKKTLQKIKESRVTRKFNE